VDRVVESVRKQNGLDEAAFRKALETEGMTFEAYRARLRWQLERSALLRVRKGKEASVTAEEAREWFLRNGDRYAAGGEVKLAVLLFPLGEGSDREKLVSAHRAAQAAAELVAQGKGFAEAAKILSGRFGDVGYQGGDFLPEADLPEELRREVRRLDPGEVSPPFFTSDGGRVVSVLARRGGKVPDFADVKDQVVEELSEKRGEKAFRDAMEELRREAAVEYRY
jgi:peptidyl-prolyl cis-trans isomerase SurA